MQAQTIKKFAKSAQIYCRYLNHALIEIYIYYTSPNPIQIILKKMALANRAIRVFWAPPSPGRKPLDQETIELIIEMKKLNPRWGGKRISDELAKIGYRANKDTVLKYLEIHGFHNPLNPKGLTWKEFLNNHKFKISIDFTSLITLSGNQLFIFVMINLDTRELIHINATYHPHNQWVTQQFKNAFFDMDDYPSLCICDRDQIFNRGFEKMVKDYFQIKLRRTPIRSPEKNGCVERFHQSLKNEAFDNVVPINLLQTQKICSDYKKYYNHYRPHQGISGNIPSSQLTKLKNRAMFFPTKHLDGKITSFNPENMIAA